MTPPTSTEILQLTPRSRLRAGGIALILLFLGGLALWAQLSEGLPRDWESGILVIVGSALGAGGMRFLYVSVTGRASELIADTLQDIGRMSWHG